MAAPITHIILSDKVFDKYFKDKNKRDFYLGTSFPDIRYLKVIERDKTHFKNLSLQEIKEEKSSFLAGLKFHSFVDEVRKKFIISNNVYSLYSDFKYLLGSQKALEDDVLYKKVNNWNEIVVFFDGIIKEELSFGIPKSDIIRWHKMLQEYFSQQPNDNTRKIFLNYIDISADLINGINSNISKMKNDQRVIQLIYEMYDRFLN